MFEDGVGDKDVPINLTKEELLANRKALIKKLNEVAEKHNWNKLRFVEEQENEDGQD